MRKDTIIGHSIQIIHVAGHHRPGPFHRALISIPEVDIPGENHSWATPFGWISESSGKSHIFRCYIRNQSVFQLWIHHVIYDLIAQVLNIVCVLDGVAHEMRNLKPAQFFSMRTIGSHTSQITAYRPINQLVDLVEQFIGTLERTYSWGAIAGMVKNSLLHNRLVLRIRKSCRNSTAQSHIPETIVGKIRLPLFACLPGACIIKIGRTAWGLLCDKPFIIKQFTWSQSKCLTGWSRHLDLRDPGGILSEIIDKCTIRHLIYTLRIKGFHYLKRIILFMLHHPTGALNQQCILPFWIIESRTIPSFLNKICIKILTTKNTGICDRRGGGFPTLVGNQLLMRTIIIANHQFQSHHWHAPGSYQLTVSLAIHIEKSIANCHPDSMCSQIKQAGHIVAIIIAGFGIESPARSQKAIVRSFTVNWQGIMSQTRNKKIGPAYFFRYLKFLSELWNYRTLQTFFS